MKGLSFSFYSPLMNASRSVRQTIFQIFDPINFHRNPLCWEPSNNHNETFRNLKAHSNQINRNPILIVTKTKSLFFSSISHINSISESHNWNTKNLSGYFNKYTGTIYIHTTFIFHLDYSNSF